MFVVSTLREKLLMEGTSPKAEEALLLARKEMIKTKVQIDDLHSQWRRNGGRLAGAVLLWEALHLKQFSYHFFGYNIRNKRIFRSSAYWRWRKR